MERIKGKRRERSPMTFMQAEQAIEDFARRIERMGASSDMGMFRREMGATVPTSDGKLTLQFLLPISFTEAEFIYEALRIYAGVKLPAKES